MKRLIIVILVLCLIGLWGIDRFFSGKLPHITFPKGAQHNTIGELPIVEMADDGVFAEVDGAEYEVNSHWCDEQRTMFTCSLKFGQSYSVARRMATKKFLESCEEARKVAQDELAFCIEQADAVRALPESINFYKDYYSDWVEGCHLEHSYIPECDGEYEYWVKGNVR